MSPAKPKAVASSPAHREELPPAGQHIEQGNGAAGGSRHLTSAVRLTDEQEEPVRVQHGDGSRRGLFEQFVVAVERATLLEVGVELGLRGVRVGKQRPDGLLAEHEVIGVARQRVAVDHFATPRADAGAEVVGFGFGGSTVLVDIEDAVQHEGEAAVRVVHGVDEGVTALDGTDQARC